MSRITELREAISRGALALSSWVADGAAKQEQGPSKRWLDRKGGVFKSGARDDYGVDVELRRTTPEKLGEACRQADQGDTKAQYEVFEEVERDPQVGRLYAKRRQGILSKSLQITSAREGDAAADKAAELANELVLGIDGQGGIADFDIALWNLTDAIGKAFSVSQVVWTMDGGLFKPTRLINWPQVNFQLGDPSVTYDDDRDAIRILTNDNRTTGVPLNDFGVGQWVVHQQKNWSQPLARAALFRSVAWYWLFKRFGTSDWSIFLERFGVPPRMGKYMPGTGEQDRRALWQAVLNLGKDHACIMPDTATIELLETKGLSAGAPHPQFVAYCNDQISIALVGSTMAVTQGERGARSAVEAFQVDEAEQTEWDCKNLAKTIREQLVKPLILSNLGATAPIPLVSFLFEDEEDLNMRSQVDERLHRMGKAIPVSYVVQTYGVPEPEEKEDVLPPVAKSQPPGAQPVEEEEREEDMPVGNAVRRASHTELVEAAKVALREAGLAEKKSSIDWVLSLMSRREP